MFALSNVSITLMCERVRLFVRLFWNPRAQVMDDDGGQRDAVITTSLAITTPLS